MATPCATGLIRPRWPQAMFMLPLLLMAASLPGQTITSHGYSPFGELRYPANFEHFDYVNPDAPKGGTLRLFGHGTFDSLNPWVMAGTSPANTPGAYIFGFLEMTDTLLMGSSGHNRVGDEPRAGYGLIAERLEYPEDLSWVSFHLRHQARFHDGEPITAEDVAFSLALLREQGHPRYALMLGNVERAEVRGPHEVRFHLRGRYRRDLPLVLGEMPILPRHYWQARDFRGTLEPPLLSGPYRVTSVRPGRQMVLERVEDYWAADLPVNRGRYNFDRVIMDFYRDAQIGFEAFKSGDYNVHKEYVARQWANAYNFPAVRDGRVQRAEIPHRLPQGTQAFFINQRIERFSDPRVREAIGLLFDFEWMNRNIFNGAYRRSNTWFPNSENRARGIPEDAELALLEGWRDELPAALFSEPVQLPVNDGSGNIRDRLRQAIALFIEAGWEIREQRLVHSETGEPFTLSILNYHNPSFERVVQPWIRNLERAGISANYRTVDPSTYKERLDRFDFEVTVFVLPQNIHAGPELLDYMHSSSAELEGSRNFAGIDDPVVDDLVERVLEAREPEQYQTAIRALDRVLMWRHYIVPHWYVDHHRLAWWDRFGRPDKQPQWSLGIETWWEKSDD